MLSLSVLLVYAAAADLSSDSPPTICPAVCSIVGVTKKVPRLCCSLISIPGSTRPIMSGMSDLMLETVTGSAGVAFSTAVLFPLVSSILCMGLALILGSENELNFPHFRRCVCLWDALHVLNYP